MNAVILAGGTIEVNRTSRQSKALLNFNGIPMIKYVINALKSCHYIEKILVIGNRNQLQLVIGKDVDILLEEKESIIDNLLLATDYFKEEAQILISTCDIPLLREEMITDFIEGTRKESKDIIYPIVEKKLCRSVFPDVKRTFVTLKNGSFTGGNLMIMSPMAISHIENVARLMVTYRKNPFKMSRVLGLRFLFKLLLQQLTLEEIEDHVDKQFHIKAKAVVNNYPEIGSDIDRINDVCILEKYI